MFLHRHQIPKDNNYKHQFSLCLINDIFYLYIYIYLPNSNNDKKKHETQEITEK